MNFYKANLLTLFLCLLFLAASSQKQKFPAPASADALVNPLKANAQATLEGKKVYIQYCAPCHGNKGKGDGIAAPGLPKPPADHTSEFVQKQTDGALFWIISEGNNPMPIYKGTLTETQRWQLVNFIRTLAKSKKN